MHRDDIRKTLNLLKFKSISRKLGKVIEFDDRIICYVSEKGLNKCLKFGIIQLSTIGSKKIDYIFDNLEIKKYVIIKGLLNINITFRNCTIYSPIDIREFNFVFFNNNNYQYNLYNFDSNTFLNIQDVNNLIINNEIIQAENNHFNIEAEEVLINGSHIESKSKRKEISFIDCHKLTLSNSAIKVNELLINAENLHYENNYINSKSVTIKDSNLGNKDIKGIIADKLIHNDFIRENSIKKITTLNLKKQIIINLKDYIESKKQSENSSGVGEKIYKK